MRKLIESTFISLDGDTSQRLMDWAPPYWDDEHASYEQRLLSDADAIVLGRRPTTGSRSRGHRGRAMRMPTG